MRANEKGGSGRREKGRREGGRKKGRKEKKEVKNEDGGEGGACILGGEQKSGDGVAC